MFHVDIHPVWFSINSSKYNKILSYFFSFAMIKVNIYAEKREVGCHMILKIKR